MTYDLIVVGAGPAGLTASIYASRYKLSNLIIGKVLGGMITLAHKVENFPGFTSISGPELGQKMVEHAKALGAEVLTETVGRIEETQAGFKVFTENGKEIEGRVLVVAVGTERRKLGVPGEEEYLGKGVSYCVTCDAVFFRDKVVALIGGSNAAVGGAVHAAGVAQKIYLIYRGDKLRADPAWVEQVLANPKIEVIYNTNIKRILGYKDIRMLGEEEKKQFNNLPRRQAGLTIKQLNNEGQNRVGGVELDNPHGNSKYLSLDGVFIEIGGVPVSGLLGPLGVKIDENGYVGVNAEMATNVGGIFAAGDLTTASGVMQQAITACAQGAIAASSAFKLLKRQKAPRLLGMES